MPWIRWIDRVSIVTAVIGGIATVGLMLHVATDVAGRALANRPLSGTLDVTQYAWMPTLIALGLGYALQRGEHIRVSLMTAPAGPRTQRWVEVASMALTLIVAALFIWFGAENAQHSFAISESAVGASWLSIWPFRWIVVIGLIVLVLQTIATMTRVLTDPDFEIEDDVEAALQSESSDVKDTAVTTDDRRSMNATDRTDAS